MDIALGRSAEFRLDPDQPAGPALRAVVAAALTRFTDAQRVRLSAISPQAEELWRQTEAAIACGKRLRSAFCLWGYAAATGDLAPTGAMITAAASLEFLHLSALVHDDVMDGSDTRRGRPAAHKQFETLHRELVLNGDDDGDHDDRGDDDRSRFGQAGAILLGDLLLMWSVEMLQRSGLPTATLARALPLIEQMRTEVTVGQYLDVLVQATPLNPAPSGAAGSDSQALLAAAERVVEYKTARYTAVRPLQFGAALGGASRELQHALAEYASPLGRAFQYRDDLLGVFGDEQLTGKPAGDDLREGKRTALVAHALAGATPAKSAELADMLGRTDLDLHRARSLIIDSGAVQRVEQMIESGRVQALTALDRVGIATDVRRGLTALAASAVDRVA